MADSPQETLLLEFARRLPKVEVRFEVPQHVQSVELLKNTLIVACGAGCAHVLFRSAKHQQQGCTSSVCCRQNVPKPMYLASSVLKPWYLFTEAHVRQGNKLWQKRHGTL